MLEREEGLGNDQLNQQVMKREGSWYDLQSDYRRNIDFTVEHGNTTVISSNTVWRALNEKKAFFLKKIFQTSIYQNGCGLVKN